MRPLAIAFLAIGVIVLFAASLADSAFALGVGGGITAGAVLMHLGLKGTPVTPKGVYIAVMIGAWIGFFLLGGEFRESEAGAALAMIGTLMLFLAWLHKLAESWGGWRWVALWLMAIIASAILIEPLPDAVPGIALAGLFIYALWTFPGYYDWRRESAAEKKERELRKLERRARRRQRRRARA